MPIVNFNYSDRLDKLMNKAKSFKDFLKTYGRKKINEVIPESLVVCTPKEIDLPIPSDCTWDDVTIPRGISFSSGGDTSKTDKVTLHATKPGKFNIEIKIVDKNERVITRGKVTVRVEAKESN